MFSFVRLLPLQNLITVILYSSLSSSYFTLSSYINSSVPPLAPLFLSPFYLPLLLQNQCTPPALPVFCAASLLLLFSSLTLTLLPSVQTDLSFFTSLPLSLPIFYFPPSFFVCHVSPPSSNSFSCDHLSPLQFWPNLFPHSVPPLFFLSSFLPSRLAPLFLFLFPPPIVLPLLFPLSVSLPN